MFKREGVCETPSPHSVLEHEPWCWRSQGLLRRQCGQVGGEQPGAMKFFLSRVTVSKFSLPWQLGLSSLM